MKFEIVKSYVLSKPNCIETYPFGDSPLVAKIGGKMFALISIDLKPCRVSLKCKPEDAIIQRGMYSEIKPGYHLNKDHWNTIILSNLFPDNLVFQLIDESYKLVFNKLTIKIKKEIGVII